MARSFIGFGSFEICLTVTKEYRQIQFLTINAIEKFKLICRYRFGILMGDAKWTKKERIR